jgi:hypothetical protein
VIVDHIGKYRYKHTQYNIEKENPQNNKLDKYKELHNEIRDIITVFYTCRIDQFTKVVVKENEFTKMIKERIEKISED